MSDPVVSLTQQGAVGIITLNRPPVNSHDMTLVGDFSAAIDQAAKEQSIRAVVITSALEKFFSAGADVKFLSQGTLQTNMGMVRAQHESLERIARSQGLLL